MTYRKKIAIFFIGYSLFLSLIYSLLIIGSLFITEDRLYEHFLNRYSQRVSQQYDKADGQASTNMALLSSKVYSNENIPAHLKNLPSGVVEVDDIHILVKRLKDNKSLFLRMPEFDNMIDQVMPFVITILIIIGVIISFLGIMVAVLLARQLSIPIEKLVSDVKHASINTNNISSSGNSTELNLLAQSFNEAMLRINMVLEREKSFTQSVSHELRTPLMVMETNLAILQTHKEPLTVLERIISRMLRATQSMSNLTDTFLMLARHDKFAIKKTPFNPATTIKSVIQTLDNSSVNWLVECQHGTELNVPDKIFEILITNIIDNGNKYAAGVATIVVTNTYLETYNTARSSGTESGSSQLGIKIIERICQAFGWQLLQTSSGTEFKLRIEF
ncbi:MAG: sensor histidine kinase [Arenicella sp.]